jgi:2,3-diketo-5-methylthio-1-phosphopentane phosphatase
MLVFSDFDGTIAKNDVGDTLFKTFGNWPECEKAVQQWLRGEISSRECLEHEAATARLTREQLDTFCDAQSLTPGFAEFVEFCRKRNWPLIVLSDGLDYYIQRLLLRHGLDLPFFANHLEFAPANRIAVSFPYFESRLPFENIINCRDGKCGNCKGYHIRRLAKPGENIVYIGDGYSDRCGAQEADIILAKGDLAKWCEEKVMEYFRFENFTQILYFVQKWSSENG